MTHDGLVTAVAVLLTLIVTVPLTIVLAAWLGKREQTKREVTGVTGVSLLWPTREWLSVQERDAAEWPPARVHYGYQAPALRIVGPVNPAIVGAIVDEPPIDWEVA